MNSFDELPENLRKKIRIEESLRPDMDTPCWTWHGCFRRKYGIVNSKTYGGTCQAHRLIYKMLVAEIPAHLDGDHLCNNTSCVNPQHIVPATRKANILRGNGRSAMNARKTHCPRCGGNYTKYAGGRACAACAKIGARLRYMRKKQTEGNPT